MVRWSFPKTHVVAPAIRLRRIRRTQRRYPLAADTRALSRYACAYAAFFVSKNWAEKKVRICEAK
jgi:hypothetical protein